MFVAVQEEVQELKRTVGLLRQQQADVAKLEKAERLMAGSYWSAAEEKRLSSLSNMLGESRSRMQAVEEEGKRVAAETVRDSLLEQLAAARHALEEKERDLTLARQRIDALSDTVAGSTPPHPPPTGPRR